MALEHRCHSHPMDEIRRETRDKSPPSVFGALHHVLEATQRVVVSHMDLIRLEAREDLTNVVSAATLIIVGGVFLVGLFVMLEALLVQALHQRFSVMASIGMAALIHAAIGSSILGVGLRRMHRIKFMKPDEGASYSGNALFPKLPQKGPGHEDRH
jgi:uncharacterized membrane protein YqjE